MQITVKSEVSQVLAGLECQTYDKQHKLNLHSSNIGTQPRMFICITQNRNVFTFYLEMPYGCIVWVVYLPHLLQPKLIELSKEIDLPDGNPHGSGYYIILWLSIKLPRNIYAMNWWVVNQVLSKIYWFQEERFHFYCFIMTLKIERVHNWRHEPWKQFLNIDLKMTWYKNNLHQA